MNFPEIAEMDNLGGNQSFSFIPFSDVALIPRPISGMVSSSISLNNGCSWFTGYSTNDYLSFDSQQVINENGSFYETKVSGFYPKPSAAFIEYLYSIRNQRFILLVKDNNGRTRIVGSILQPCALSFVEKTGLRAQDLPGVAFEFRCESYQHCYFYYL